MASNNQEIFGGYRRRVEIFLPCENRNHRKAVARLEGHLDRLNLSFVVSEGTPPVFRSRVYSSMPVGYYDDNKGLWGFTFITVGEAGVNEQRFERLLEMVLGVTAAAYRRYSEPQVPIFGSMSNVWTIELWS